MDASAWSAQLLNEFIAAVSSAGTEAAAARAAVEHAAEALDADVAAIVRGGELVAAVGYPEGRAPVAELEGVKPGVADAWLEVPGAGRCAAAAATLEYPPGATFVLARSEPQGWTREETGLLRGMARVAATTMRLLRVLDDERSAREELRTIADEQAALRHMATLVARGAPPAEVFSAVAEEVGNVLPAADVALVGRYRAGHAIEYVGGWSRQGGTHWVGQHVSLGGHNVATLVFESNEPARVGHLVDDATAVTAAARASGSRSSAGAPINVEGRLWGVMAVGSIYEDGLPAGVEQQLADFTDLVATAIANAEAQAELRQVAEEQAALRRVAVLVARAAPPDEVFAAVTAQVGQVLDTDFTTMSRYDPDGWATVLAAWARTGAAHPFRAGDRFELGGRNVHTLVLQSRRPARIDDYVGPLGPAAAALRAAEMRSGVGAPISVAGRLWGVVTVGSARTEPLPADSEARLVGFTELVATAIANAQARVELRGYAGEQAALRRVAVLVAQGMPPEEVFAAVADEVGRVLNADFAYLERYDADRLFTVVGAWARAEAAVPVPVGSRWNIDGRNVTTLTWQTRRPVRIDDYAARASGAAVDGVPSEGIRSTAEVAREFAISSVVGVPVSVGGRLWGVVAVANARAEPLPPDTEARLAGFTELVGTAIANAESQAALTASRARIVATADAARRRIERDLHDGAQQHLVSLIRQLRAAKAEVGPGAAGLTQRLDSAAAGLTGVLDELREIARGLHPAILADGGLRLALKALARRSAVPVQLHFQAEGQLPEPIEIAAYYLVSEALTNTAKHANASVVEVGVATGDGVLHVRVRDDGRGGAAFGRGSGLVGLRDRVEALGGRLWLHSPPGAGTTMEISLPLGDPGTAGLLGEP
jgi:signal transduction histidine kinase